MKNERKETSMASPSIDDNQSRSWFGVSERWKSDMAFFRDEFRFFTKLLNKHLLWSTADDNIATMRTLLAEIQKLANRGNLIDHQIAEHMMHIADLTKEPFAHDSQKVSSEHSVLEGSVTVFFHEFREVKSRLFRVIENVIDSE